MGFFSLCVFLLRGCYLARKFCGAEAEGCEGGLKLKLTLMLKHETSPHPKIQRHDTATNTGTRGHSDSDCDDDAASQTHTRIDRTHTFIHAQKKKKKEERNKKKATNKKFIYFFALLPLSASRSMAILRYFGIFCCIFYCF